VNGKGRQGENVLQRHCGKRNVLQNIIGRTICLLCVCGMGFELRAYTLSHSTSPFMIFIYLFIYFWRLGFLNYLPGLASHCDPPDLCLLSS
jgi:hypothetical protein